MVEKILNNTTPYEKIRASHEGSLHSSIDVIEVELCAPDRVNTSCLVHDTRLSQSDVKMTSDFRYDFPCLNKNIIDQYHSEPTRCRCYVLTFIFSLVTSFL